ncbi:MAG: polyhydroxyalkanoic acid system family protein, partial [Plesiomonas sp.]
MSAIYIKRTHSLGMEKARNISQTVAEEIAGKYQISWQWREQDLIFRHP